MKRLFLLLLVMMVGAGCWTTPADVAQMNAEQLREVYPSGEHVRQAVRERWIELNPDWSEQHKADILAGTLRTGMTPDMVRALYGNPGHIDKSNYGWGKIEDWVYVNQWPHNYYAVHFRNGVVSDWTSMSRRY